MDTAAVDTQRPAGGVTRRLASFNEHLAATKHGE
jgi:hypothetical protein